MPTLAPDAMKLIKRYSNRKLYDTERSSYVTLDEIAEMVRRGEDLQIIDKKTGNDLTTMTLAQIVYEEEKKNRKLLPLATLRMMIQSPRELVQRLSRPVADLRDETARQAERLRRRSESQAEDLSTPLRDLVETVQRNIEEMQERVDARVRDAIEVMSNAPQAPQEPHQLEARVAALEREVRRLQDANEVTAAPFHAGRMPAMPARPAPLSRLP